MWRVGSAAPDTLEARQNQSRRDVKWFKAARKKGGAEKRGESIERHEGGVARLKTREGELTVGIFNVRTLAVNGKNGLGYSEDIIGVCKILLGCRRRDGMGRMGSQQRFHCVLQWSWRRWYGCQGSTRSKDSHQGVDLARCREGWTGCGVHQCSTHEGTTRLEGEIELDFLCGCGSSD